MDLFGWRRIGDLEARVARLTREVEALRRHLGVTGEDDLAPEVEEQIRGFLERGQPAEAIRAYRAATGAGLGEAKAAIDDRRRRRNVR